jgi:UDP:flavonoid glycosyltransferase YjiC (YdhE family)
MKVAVLAYGSRGDVQPAVALASALAARGHAASLIAPSNFGALAAGRGVDFRPLPIDTAEGMHDAENERLFAEGGDPFAFLRWLNQAGRKIGALAPTALASAKGAELIVPTGLMDSLGGMLAERLRAPCVYAWWQPMLAARDFLFSAGETAPPRFPGWGNRAMFLAYEQAMWLIARRGLRSARELYELPAAPFQPPLRRAVARGATLLLAYSAAPLARSRDWPANVEVTGSWFLDDGARWTPPPGLERFLADGAAPVYVGFGSMSLRDADALLDAILGALARVCARAIVSAGWGGLGGAALPPAVFALDEAPHDWLFPRMAAIVHHGGAGTTGAALRAGKPSVVTPFIADQFAWARLLAARGLAPPPLPRRALTAERLAVAIGAALNDSAMRQRAAAIGATVRAEDGLARAVAAIERCGEPESLGAMRS